jgi:hypothetical protein
MPNYLVRCLNTIFTKGPYHCVGAGGRGRVQVEGGRRKRAGGAKRLKEEGGNWVNPLET